MSRTIKALVFALMQCISAFYTKDGQLYSNNDQPLRIRGMNWFGFETQDKVVNGLWAHPMSFYFDLLQEEGVNFLRVPFSAEWVVKNPSTYPWERLISADPELPHKTSFEILDMFFDMAHRRGMFILLDLHRLDWDYISEVWYSTTDNRFFPEDFMTAWFTVLDRYKNHSALFGIDLKNEPHGMATWGDKNPLTDWAMFSEQAITRIEERYPGNRWIYMVEGIKWGKDLSGVLDSPVRVPLSASNRIVYSAHNYGNSVVPSINVDDVEGLHRDWDEHFGKVRQAGYTVVTGEYGGLTSVDQVWMRLYVHYLQTRNMTDAFFWSLGPNSGDVGGYLLDDWTHPDSFKRNIIHELQPDPFPKSIPPRNLRA